MENNRFTELKQIILDRARENNACREQYRRAYASENIDALMFVIRDNFFWCTNNNVLDGELIDEYRGEFSQGRIWHNENASEGYVLASGSASVEAYDSASVRASGSASVEAYDNASVEAYDNASVLAYGSASVEAYDNASVEAYDNASVEAYDNASVEAYGSAYVVSYATIECQLNGNAIHRITSVNKIRYANSDMSFEIQK